MTDEKLHCSFDELISRPDYKPIERNEVKELANACTVKAEGKRKSTASNRRRTVKDAKREQLERDGNEQKILTEDTHHYPRQYKLFADIIRHSLEQTPEQTWEDRLLTGTETADISGFRCIVYAKEQDFMSGVSRLWSDPLHRREER
jgi:hypothetical protein